jgi:tetratricopeptide (TPR) repeat protein
MKFNFLVLLLYFSISLFAKEYDFSNFETYVKETRNEIEFLSIVKYSKAGEDKKVIKVLEKSIDTNNKSVYLDYLYLGDLYSKNQDKNNAISSYKESINYNNSFATSYYKLANEKLCNNESISLLNQAIQLNQKFEDAYYNLGYIYRTCIIDYTKSEAIFNKLISINPNDYQPYSQLSLIYDIQKNYKKAILFAKKAIELNKDDYYSYLNLYYIYMNADNKKDAFIYLTKAKAILLKKDKDLEASTSLAYLYYIEGKNEQSIALYNKLLKKKLKPYLFYKIHLDLAMIYKEKEKHTLIIKHLEAIQNNKYITNEYIIYLSSLYLSKEKNELAKETISKIKVNNLYPDNYEISLIYFKLKEWEKASKFISKALKKKPYSIKANILSFTIKMLK